MVRLINNSYKFYNEKETSSDEFFLIMLLDFNVRKLLNPGNKIIKGLEIVAEDQWKQCEIPKICYIKVYMLML